MSSSSPQPRPAGGGARKPIPWRLYLGIVAVVVAVVVILQNQDDAPFHVLFWTVTLPTWVMLLIALALGVVVGWLLHYRRSSRK